MVEKKEINSIYYICLKKTINLKRFPYKMPLPPTSSEETQEKNQEAEKAKMARLEYERKEREAEYVKNWLLEQKKKSKERYLKTKERKMALKQSNLSV